MRRVVSSVFGAVLVAIVLAIGGTPAPGRQPALAQQTASPSPTPTTSPPRCNDEWDQIDRDDPRSGNTFEGIAATSSQTAWAVGSAYSDGGQPIPLIKRWDRPRWERIRVDGRFFLHDVDAGETGSVWAVGEGSSGSTLSSYALRRTSSGWKRTAIVNPSASLTAINDVTALSKRHVWASGTYWDSAAQHRVLIEHWNGRRWNVAPVSNIGLLDDIFARTRDDVWAVGRTVRDGRAVPLTLRFGGRRWRQVPSPSAGRGQEYLYGVSASARDFAWAVGERSVGRRTHPILMGWNGDRWRNVDPGFPDGANALLRAVSVYDREVVAVGTYSTRYTSAEAFILTRRPGSQTWERHLLSNFNEADELYDVEHAPNGAVYAAGYSSARGGSEAVFFRPPLCP